MKLWPFSKKSAPREISKKTWDQLTEPQQNTLLESLYKWQLHAGTATTILDNPTTYLREGYVGNPDVYAIINRIVRMASQATLRLYKIENGKKVEIVNHELSAFCRNANPTMKMTDFIQAHLIYKLSIGNVYWYKPQLTAGVNKGKTIELWMMPSNNVQILGGDTWMKPVGGYNLIRNVTIKFNPEDIYHSKFFNPMFGDYGNLYGLSPLKAAARTISKQNQAVLTELKQFENQSPPYILYRDTQDPIMGSLSPEQTGQVEAMFKDYGDKHKAGRPIVMPDRFGMLKLGVSPVDLGILESNIEGRRVLCSIYGVQSELFNDKARSTYNNVLEVKKDAWNNCVKPNLDGFAEDLTTFLIDPVAEYKGHFYEFDYSSISELQTDKGEMVKWMREAWWTPDEIREATGQEAYDNPLMKEPWVPMGYAPISSISGAAEPDGDETPDTGLKNFGDY